MTTRRSRFLAGVLGVLAACVFAAAAAAAVPANTAAPSINGTPLEGRVLTAGNGTWSNSPTSFSYRWQRCNAQGSDCAAITGATART